MTISAVRNPAEIEDHLSWRSMLRRCCAPDVHLRNVYDREAEATDATREARDWLTSKETMLVLLGGVGTGKTAAAVEAMTQQTERTASSMRFLGAPELVPLLRFDQAAELRKVRDMRFLVIDDLGTEYADEKGWLISGLDALVNYRYGEGLRTVITANLSAADFKARYGERIVDRLRECGRVVTIGGPSRRGRQ